MLKSTSRRDFSTFMFTAALLTIAKTWEQIKCPPRDEWIKKMQSIHTMEYNSGIKKKEILPFATTWMDLENIMPVTESQIPW